ncbi:uncharacterized protein LOC142789839 [Rhipicephalus microplus]|uniref:uncharacterized protein LOC142789839 n=1 Tax=Rhipicephalus microplus TaxID=6941 RepID=UPI003F6D578B
MRVHSIEPDFHVLCGIDGCAASFRRYFAYKKHVYRVHRNAAGIIVNELAPDCDSSEQAEDIFIPIVTNLSEAHSHDAASNICFITKIKKQLAMFYVKITEKLKLASSTTDKIFCIVKSLIQDVIDGLMQRTVKLLMEGSVAPGTAENVVRQLNATDILSNMFSDLESTHMRKKYISKHFNYTELNQVSLQTANYRDIECYVPISKLLVNFLKSEDLLECISQPTAKPQELLCDFTDGDAFSRYDHLNRDSSNNTIFLLLYTDELELVNPLGAAAGRYKILAVYFSVLNLHPRHRSKLCSIHLLLVVEYRVVFRHGMEKVLQPLLQDLHLIQQNGVHSGNLHFIVAIVAFIGDNLSMHHLAGLQCSFSRGRVCRYCLASHKQLLMLRKLDDCVERTSETYKSHLEAFALDPTVNGPMYCIASASPLQTLENFDITEQLPPDAMHDILEGGMECVIRHVLGGLVGDRVIRKQDLERISSFKHIADIVLAEKIPRSCVPYLQVKVEEFLELYTVQYPNAAVTPKLSFLLHYPKYILKYGPPRRYWGMRFEAKHSYFKRIASKTKNFKNIGLTLATRHQLLQAYELSGNMLKSDLETTGAKQLILGDLPEQQQLDLRKVSVHLHSYNR